MRLPRRASRPSRSAATGALRASRHAEVRVADEGEGPGRRLEDAVVADHAHLALVEDAERTGRNDAAEQPRPPGGAAC